MRGILGWGTYVPYRRLDLSEIGPVAGAGGGRGHRSVASYDEDTTTMAVEAARRVTGPQGNPEPASLWFSTVEPAYLDKTNATAVHAALSLGRSVPAYDVLGSMRSAMGALRGGLGSDGPALVISSGLRTGRPGSAEEAAGGDGSVALLVGGPDDGPVLAELAGWCSLTEEFVDRWRLPGELGSRTWEERFGETRYVSLAQEAWDQALEAAGAVAEDVDQLVVAGAHGRAVASSARKTGVDPARHVTGWAGQLGNLGGAEPALLLVTALERSEPGQLVAQLVLADGADVLLWRVTEAMRQRVPSQSVEEQARGGGRLPYGRYLSWRGLLGVEPPRRPAPARPSASAAARSAEWKFGLVGSERDGEVHMPPSLLDHVPHPVAGSKATIVTFTVDRLAYSPSPPVVFAVVDFDGGGRLPVELTDVDPDEVAIGGRVEMTFRRLFTADGIHNYFWKARPVRAAGG